MTDKYACHEVEEEVDNQAKTKLQFSLTSIESISQFILIGLNIHNKKAVV